MRYNRWVRNCVFVFLGVLIATVLSVSGQAAPILFKDDFSAGASPEWVSVKPSQFVIDGWFHSKDQVIDDVRNSGAFVHVGDTSWRDYSLQVKVDPIAGTDPFTGGITEHADVFFRVSSVAPAQFGFAGDFYSLLFKGPLTDNDPTRLTLSRYDGGTSATPLFDEFGVVTSSGPMNVVVNLDGARIRVAIDGAEVINVIDPAPILHGGIGVGAIWEAEARFDDVTVVPEPTTGALFLAGLLVVVGFRCMKKRQRNVSCGIHRAIQPRIIKGT